MKTLKINKIVTVGKQNKTLRISIPTDVSSIIGIKEKDVLEWIIDYDIEIKIRKKDDTNAEEDKHVTKEEHEENMVLKRKVKVGRQNQTLRITIPKIIINLFDIKEKDQLKWTLYKEDNEIKVKISPLSIK